MTILGIILLIIVGLAVAIFTTSSLLGGGKTTSHYKLEDGSYMRNHDPKAQRRHSQFNPFV